MNYNKIKYYLLVKIKINLIQCVKPKVGRNFRKTTKMTSAK